MQLAKMTGPGPGSQIVDKDAAVAFVHAAANGMTNLGGKFSAMLTIDGSIWSIIQDERTNVFDIVWPSTGPMAEWREATDAKRTAQSLRSLADRMHSADSFAAFLVINGETWVIAP